MSGLTMFSACACMSGVVNMRSRIPFATNSGPMYLAIVAPILPSFLPSFLPPRRPAYERARVSPPALPLPPRWMLRLGLLQDTG
eukprot:CAMPEP_0184523912 /NCGR_PEP_ID=MMETSP0198_2-20121128/9180_1 /TAXON_ID=1112570 /ORGANISM="Thraustochytrium sp., Strain LLF1b" /LENGTH=83 /DNA_ID=CAMNT_0026915061 /DNA_START=322 /DNA_END=569 /DNA_ORIENTATION=-